MKVPKEAFSNSGFPAPAGSSALASSTALRISVQAGSISDFGSVSDRSIWMTESPGRDTELISEIAATPRSSASIFSVTSASTRAGSAPG